MVQQIMLTFIIKPENYKKMFFLSNFVIDVHKIRFILYGKKLPFLLESEKVMQLKTN